MIVFETISAATAAEQWYGNGKPYGFAVSSESDRLTRLAEVRAAWPHLDLDESHSVSVADAQKLGFLL